MAWPDLATRIAAVEREEAAHGLRIVTVLAKAERLPVQNEQGRRIHPGTFGGWEVREAQFDDALVAVIGLSDGSNIGMTAEGALVEVVHG